MVVVVITGKEQEEDEYHKSNLMLDLFIYFNNYKKF